MDYTVVESITIKASPERVFDAVLYEWSLSNGTKDHPMVRHPEGPIMEGTELRMSSPRHEVFIKICFKKLNKPTDISIRQEMPTSKTETVFRISEKDGMSLLKETCTLSGSSTDIFFAKIIYWWKARKVQPLHSIKQLAESDKDFSV